MKHFHQKGFALTDALIAAAIAAGVAVTAAQSISIAVRSARQAKEINRVIDDAEIIAARIEAGLTGNALLAGLEGWELGAAPFEPGDDVPSRNSPYIKLTATHPAAPVYSVDWVITNSEAQ